MKNISLSILMLMLLLGCETQESKQKAEESNLETLAKLSALPKDVLAPTNNPTTEEKVALGKALFFDPILSGNKDVACATCHHPSSGYAEFLDLSIGVNGKGLGSERKFKEPNDIPFVKRNAHTIINTAFNGIDTRNKYNPETAPMFWDIRSKSLESQALEPIKSLEEMRGHAIDSAVVLDSIVARLSIIPEYQKLFLEVFHEEKSITVENVGKAIAAFERSLVTNNSRFDQYMRGDEEAISLAEKHGLELFKKVGCANCHNGPMLSDYIPHTLGVPENDKLGVPDDGLDKSFAFRTPTLRNLRFTAPYMHNGSMKTLKEVLEFYEDIAAGKEKNPNVKSEDLDPLVSEIDLKASEMDRIISFLNTLNDESFDQEIPESVPSGLPVGGDIK
ncbi:MAG: c-type cytochrome [Cyclobacteriaceae bacterium]